MWTATHEAFHISFKLGPDRDKLTGSSCVLTVILTNIQESPEPATSGCHSLNHTSTLTTTGWILCGVLPLAQAWGGGGGQDHAD